jgi:hypothetical protein
MSDSKFCVKQKWPQKPRACFNLHPDRNSAMYGTQRLFNLKGGISAENNLPTNHPSSSQTDKEIINICEKIFSDKQHFILMFWNI